MIMSNVRVDESRLGDIQAQAAALAVGELGLLELINATAKRWSRRQSSAARSRRRADAARIAKISDGTFESETFVDSNGIVENPLRIRFSIRKADKDLYFDLSRSSPPCKGPMNIVIATTRSAVSVAIRHVFPDVPMDAGSFDACTSPSPAAPSCSPSTQAGVGLLGRSEPAHCQGGARGPGRGDPRRLFAASAGACGNVGSGGFDPRRASSMSCTTSPAAETAAARRSTAVSNGCSITGISKMPPVEVLEQRLPVLFDEFSLAERPAGAGFPHGGFGVRYAIRLRRGQARASFVMDHGRYGPPGALGGRDARFDEVGSRARASSTGRRTRRRTRTSSWRRATSSRCARRAAAARRSVKREPALVARRAPRLLRRRRCRRRIRRRTNGR